MRASVVLGTINALVLMVAVGVAVGEHVTDAEVAATAAEPGGHPSERPHDSGGDATAVLVAADERGDTRDGQEHQEAADGQDGADPSGDQAAPLEMGRAAQVVAACESGKRLASGTPVMGSHRWHITNNHGGTDSGAFQFVDSTWRRVAPEIGAGQYARAKDAPPRVQLEAFEWLWRRSPGAWNASRSCWGPVLGG